MDQCRFFQIFSGHTFPCYIEYIYSTKSIQGLISYHDKKYRQIDGWTDEQMDGWTDRWNDGRTEKKHNYYMPPAQIKTSYLSNSFMTDYIKFR